MTEKLYSIYDGGKNLLGCHMPIDIVMLLVWGYSEKFYAEPLKLTIVEEVEKDG